MAAGYIHSLSEAEQARLMAQADFLEPYIFPTIDFSGCARVLEVGCGVGAELKILRRRYPRLHLTGLDHSELQLHRAREWLDEEISGGRLELMQGSAYELPFAAGTFDGACLIWVLEHLTEPERALVEVGRVLRPGGLLSVTEVHNASWQASPPCPAMTEYWRAFNTLQCELGGRPDVGKELTALADSAGFNEIVFRTLPVQMDARMAQPAARQRFIDYWQTLWLSGAAQLRERGMIADILVAAVLSEFTGLAGNPEAVFHYSACQMQARVPAQSSKARGIF